MELIDVRLGGSRVPHQHEIRRDHTLSPPRLVHRMIIQNLSSFEAELINQGCSHNGPVRSVQRLAPWNVILLHARLSQANVAFSDVSGIKVGYARRKPTPIRTENDHRPMAYSRLEDKPRTRLEPQFLVQSSAELLSLYGREVPTSSPVHKLVTFDSRKARPERKITIMKFDTRTESFNHATRQVSLKRIVSY